MSEEQAEVVARALSGEAWHSGGGIWLVLIKTTDGRLIVMSDESVGEYESEEAFEEGRMVKAIELV